MHTKLKPKLIALSALALSLTLSTSILSACDNENVAKTNTENLPPNVKIAKPLSAKDLESIKSGKISANISESGVGEATTYTYNITNNSDSTITIPSTSATYYNFIISNEKNASVYDFSATQKNSNMGVTLKLKPHATESIPLPIDNVLKNQPKGEYTVTAWLTPSTDNKEVQSEFLLKSTFTVTKD